MTREERDKIVFDLLRKKPKRKARPKPAEDAIVVPAVKAKVKVAPKADDEQPKKK
jgi:hypothetical protein